VSLAATTGGLFFLADEGQDEGAAVRRGAVLEQEDALANWLEIWLTMRPRFTARPLSEITPIVRPEAQQNPSDPVISESYQGLGMI
jgi:hypothetical protein